MYMCVCAIFDSRHKYFNSLKLGSVTRSLKIMCMRLVAKLHWKRKRKSKKRKTMTGSREATRDGLWLRQQTTQTVDNGGPTNCERNVGGLNSPQHLCTLLGPPCDVACEGEKKYRFILTDYILVTDAGDFCFMCIFFSAWRLWSAFDVLCGMYNYSL